MYVNDLPFHHVYSGKFRTIQYFSERFAYRGFLDANGIINLTLPYTASWQMSFGADGYAAPHNLQNHPSFAILCYCNTIPASVWFCAAEA